MKKLMFNDLSDKAQGVFGNDYNFVGFQNMLTEVWKPNFEAYDENGEKITLKDANTTIRHSFLNLLGLDETASVKQIRRAVKNNQNEWMAIVEDAVDDNVTSGWTDNEFFNTFVETKYLNLGDKNEFISEDKTVLSVARIAGNHHDIDRQKLGYGKRFRVDTYWVGLKVYDDFERIMLGTSDWSKLVNAISDAVRDYVNEVMYSAVMGAAKTILPTGGQFKKTGELDAAAKDQFLTMVESVQAANRNSEVVIMGTKSALAKLAKISDVSWLSEQDKLDRRNLGRLGIWEGIRLVEIPQVFKKNTTDFAVDNKKLLVMPTADNKFIKLVYEGDSMITEVTDRDTYVTATNDYEYQTKLGVAAIFSRYFGEWTLV